MMIIDGSMPLRHDAIDITPPIIFSMLRHCCLLMRAAIIIFMPLLRCYADALLLMRVAMLMAFDAIRCHYFDAIDVDSRAS